MECRDGMQFFFDRAAGVRSLTLDGVEIMPHLAQIARIVDEVCRHLSGNVSGTGTLSGQKACGFPACLQCGLPIVCLVESDLVVMVVFRCVQPYCFLVLVPFKRTLLTYDADVPPEGAPLDDIMVKE